MTKEIMISSAAKFKVNHTIEDNLLKFKGREVVVHLNSGKTLQGNIKAVGNNLVHLEKLAGGRDFYEGLIHPAPCVP